MFVESLDKLPEELHSQFVEVEIDGKKGFQDLESQKAFNLVKTVKEEKRATQTKLAELNERLEGFEAQKVAEIEAAKAEAEAAKAEALEQAKNKGDVDAIEKQYQEQMADLETRTAERVRQEMTQEFTVTQAKNAAALELKDISMALKPLDDSVDMLNLVLQSRQKVDENGNIIYLNADGSASTLDKAGLINELKETPSVKRLIQPVHTVEGGGKAKGSSDGSATPSQNTVAEQAKKEGNVTGFLAASLNNANI